LVRPEVVLCLVLVGGTVVVGPPAEAGQPALSWLAAGDSYSSGEGLPHASGNCAQATPGNGSQAWAFAAYGTLSKEDTLLGQPALVACTGAKTAQFFSPSGSDLGEWSPPDQRFDLVTMTFGGDDIGFAPIIKQCIDLTRLSQVLREIVDDWVPVGTGTSPLPSNSNHTCPSKSVIRQRIAALGSAYPAFLTKVATNAVAPGGNIVLLGYPDLIELPKYWSSRNQHLGSCFGIGTDDATLLRGWAGDLNATLGEAVKRFDAESAGERDNVEAVFVDVNSGGGIISSNDPNLFEPAHGTRHNLCSSDSWLNGITTIDYGNGSFHPKQAGADAQGALAAEVIAKLNWSQLPTPTLAVLSNGTLSLWKDGALSRIGPVSVEGSSGSQVVSAFEWSSDGRYLGFQQGILNSVTSSETVWFDTATRKTVSWPENTEYGSAWAITPGGEEDLQPATSPQSGAELMTFHLDGTTTHQSVPVPPSLFVSGSSAGFVVGPDSLIGDGGGLEMVALNGAVTNLPSLPAVSSESTPYEDQALSPDGKVYIAELGDHTDGCGVGPPSQLFVVDIAAGSVQQVPLPAGPNWRVVSLGFDPDGAIDATMTDCGSIENATVFNISPTGAINFSSTGMLSMTTDTGQVASQPGEAQVQAVDQNPELVSTASGPMTIDGQAVAGTSSNVATIAWAP
jgi:hypothetical protein